jgi:biopolymer transport protein ExbB
MTGAIDVLLGLVELGGPVVAILLAMSVVSVAVILWKLAAFFAARVGRHDRLKAALAAWDQGDSAEALAAAHRSRSHLAPLVIAALKNENPDAAFRERLLAGADARIYGLERGFRLLDSIAQVAPLMGLFGTVLGMIDAFQALQGAGSSVDPSVLAGGIWVALLTTAVGLGVAMPTSVLLTWLESRVDQDRIFAENMIARAFSPSQTRDISQPSEMSRHGTVAPA